MSTVPHVITQYDDDEAAEVALVVSTTHTNTQKEKRLVQMSLSSMLVRRYGSGGNFRRGYRNVVVKGHFRSNGSYVKEHVRQVRVQQGRHRQTTILTAFDVSRCNESNDDYRKSRALAAKLHFDDLIEMHNRNYPKNGEKSGY